MTCVLADGVNRTPAVLFTYNQEFRFDRHPTLRRDAQVELLRQALTDFGIDERRVLYVGSASHESRVYLTEDIFLAKRFFELYPDGWLHDPNQGNWSRGGLVQFGALAHFTFPPAVHQHLSVNDNGLHGSAKVAWRARRDFHMSDDVRASLALLQELDHVEGENIRQAFRVNLQLGREPTEAGALEAMGHDRRQISPWHAACQRELRVWSGKDARGEVPDAPEGLESGLDGLYWQ